MVMKRSLDVTWSNNMKFVANIDNHSIIIDAAPDVGGNEEGPRPKSFMMLALGGCTGMDVISILKKMKVDVTYFNVKIDADVSDEHPKKFLSMKVIYEIKGNNIDYEKVERAVNLSIDKYCGVNANFKDSMRMEYEIKIL
jgi:putative redox protein